MSSRLDRGQEELVIGPACQPDDKNADARLA